MNALQKPIAASRTGGAAPARTAAIGHNSAMQIELVATRSLARNPESARKYSPADVRNAVGILDSSGVRNPLLINSDNEVLVGELTLLAALKVGLETVPVLRVEDLGPLEAQRLAIAYNRLGEIGDWELEKFRELTLRFEAEIPDFGAHQIGFEVGDFDVKIGAGAEEEEPEEDLHSLSSKVPISKLGDLWLLRDSRIICGDSTQPSTITTLMAGKVADMGLCDPPFGCPGDGFVSGKGRHRDFVMGSNMSEEELSVFFSAFIAAMCPHLKSGAVVELVIDWRSLHVLLNAAVPILGKLLNLAVWAKDRAGMGGFLRSQHELILIFKAGKGKARNNVQLGRFGRDRSNVWNYPSAKTASTGSDEGNILQSHPTPKNVRMIADAILDCTKRGDIVLDSFLGSGTTLIAAEKVGRVCYASELDPLYVDLAIRRWQAWTGDKAVHAVTGRSFDEIEAETLSSL